METEPHFSNYELVELFRMKAGKRANYRINTVEPLLPFIMMDAVLQLYTQFIAPLKLTHELKYCRKLWKEAYHDFNSSFFRSFNTDQTDQVISKMDSLEKYIGNDLVITRIAIMECYPNDGIDVQTIVSTCHLCNILAQSAQIFWQKSYKTEKGNDESNPHLAAIEKRTSEFRELYPHSKDHKNINDSKKVCDCVDALIMKMVRWLYKVDYMQEVSGDNKI